MASGKAPNSSRSMSQDWKLQRIRQLEAEVRHLQDQLGQVSLNHAAQLLLISQIYNKVSLTPEKTPLQASIVDMIDRGNNVKPTSDAENVRRKASDAVIDTCQGGGKDFIVTPPLTSPDSPSMAPMASGDEESSRNIQKKGEATRPPLQEGSEASKMKGMPDVDLLGISCHSQTTTPNVEEPAMTHKMHGQHKPQNSKVVDGNVDIDEMWQEFTLEEELEGIADAPIEERAAMRIALKEKEDARRKRLKESAENKRIIAEKEGLHLRQTLLKASLRTAPKTRHKPEVKPCTFPQKLTGKVTNNIEGKNDRNDSTRNSSISNSNVYNKKNGKVNDKVQASDENHVKENNESDNENGGKNRNGKTVVEPHLEDDDLDNSSISIISLDADSPKAIDRFDIRFDPAELDAETTAKISGMSQSKDTRRSILIQNLPLEFSMHKVLAHVRGGTVVSARLVPDSMTKEMSSVAMIIFKTAQEAHRAKSITAELLAYSEAEAEKHQFCHANLPKISVSLLPTPTYPSHEVVAVKGRISSGPLIIEETTRCLVVDGFPRHLIHDLCTELLLGVSHPRRNMHTLEEIWFSGDTLHLQYASIKEAVKAHRIISFFYYSKYSSQVHFVPDPCAAPFISVSDVFKGSVVKLASRGHMGLKSLLETVGLVAYSRSQDKLRAKKAMCKTDTNISANIPSSSTQLAMQNSKGGTTSLALFASFGADASKSTDGEKVADLLIEPALDDADVGAGKVEMDCGTLSVASSTPWTAELMAGLDKL